MAFFTTAIVAGWLGVAESSFLASVSAFALNAAVGVGLSLAAQELTKPKSTAQAINGVNGTLQAGGDIARSFILGRRVTAGSLAYANTWGEAGKTPNAYFTQVIALSDIPINTISAVWVNGSPVTIDTSNTVYGDWGFPVVEYADGSNNNMWIKFYDGTQTVADPFLVGTVSSADRPYEATRVGVGVAYAVVTSQANDELFTGFPTFRFEVQGARLYDVSKDSTAGGSGSHRWSDPSTWGGDGDDLPVVQAYNLLRGITYNGAWLYGLQSLTGNRLPASDWIAQINKCRAGIDGPAGIEPTYLTGIEVSVNAEIGTSIESLLTGCQGRMIETGGIYKMRVGDPGASVFAFGDGDIISTEEQTFTPFFGLSDTVNGISATYPEPNEAWNTKTAPPLYNTTFENQDGSRRLMSNVDMNMVYRASQVQRIMLSALREARRARRLTFVLPPSAWVLEPGDVVTFTSNRNGFVLKLFRVDGVADHANLDVTLDLTEVDPTDYDWDQEHDYTPPVFAPLGPVKPPAQPMYGWQVEPAVLTDSDGQPWRPTIKVSCDPTQKDVRNVWVQVRLAATADVVFDSQQTPYAEPFAWLLNANFKGGTDYEARGRFIPFSGRATDWSDWLPVTTPDVATDDLIVDLQHVKSDILNRFKELQADLDDTRTLLEQLTTGKQMTDVVFSQDGRKLTSQLDQASATFSEQIATVVDEVSAVAEQTTLVSADLNDRFAEGLIEFRAAADQTGVDARFSVVLRAGSSSAFVESGMFLEIYTQGGVQKSRFSVLADQFTVLNPDAIGTAYLPLVFEGGVLKLQNVKVEWADIVNALITSAQIQDAAITSAKIGNLQVGVSNLDFDVVTTQVNQSYSGSSVAAIGTVSVPNPNPNPCFIYFDLSLQSNFGGSTGSATLQLVNIGTGAVLASRSISGTGIQSGSWSNVVAFDFRPGAPTTNQYQWQLGGATGFTNITVRAVYILNKR
ncbi:DUF1983 domain-containing protein [Neorhizobium sp. P12A]|uniref:phage tail protein n=1 Tax=Neorhizobium sp. P12A TaxID=2268027 RepID=UPI0011ED1662|nr:phage tail protein [Neorhizobium sp. P12A]KAA0689864.1 DUF1983 domain-containing protein [Neorhizobium sp. P12A]